MFYVPILTLISAAICFCSIVVFFWTKATTELPLLSSHQYSPASGRPTTFQWPLEPPCVASWSTWFDPKAWSGGASDPYGGANPNDWNILYHLGGNGPWIQLVDGVVAEAGIGPPNGCEVHQVHMLSRHAERYPTTKAGIRMLDMLSRIHDANITVTGDLAFLKNWKFFVSNPVGGFEQLTSTGPYAGRLEAFSTGTKLRTRYRHLFPQRLPPGGGKTSLWASGNTRVVDTSRYFSAGFFGLDWEDTANIHVIPETADRGGNTLTPGHSCTAYLNDQFEGHDQGNKKLIEFRSTYMPEIANRLEKQLLGSGSNRSFHLTDDEIFAMQEMCGFEITVRGRSPWCNVFTRAEWDSFEYARDVMHFYRGGPGNKYAIALGSLWLNATARLLAEGIEAGPFFFSFVHDGDITPVLAFLNLFPVSRALPVSGDILVNRAWRMSQTVPMGGRIIFERMSCGQSGEEFVRINVNDGVVALPGCHSGPGSSCPLTDFLNVVARRQQEGGRFREVCKLDDRAPERISFLHQ